MSGDPTTWNAGDFHSWVRPESPPCPDCPCCAAALCRRAVERDTSCNMEGTGTGSYDLSLCPCWRDRSAMRARLGGGADCGCPSLDGVPADYARPHPPACPARIAARGER